jgi:predicted Zn-dependent protease
MTHATFTTLRQRFQRLPGDVDFCSLRYVEEDAESLVVRQDIEQPLRRRVDRGAMISVIHRGGYGYAATADISDAGLAAAFARAKAWAEHSARFAVFDYSKLRMPKPVGRYQGPGGDAGWSRRELLELLMQESRGCRLSERVVDWSAALGLNERRQLYLSSDGADAEQQFHYVAPAISVTAYGNGDSQTRSFGDTVRQGGLELLAQEGFIGAGRRTAEEALALLDAPNCPSGSMDLLLLPAQMMLQIHESIGHPLELDRILGDERNYAGTSFVSLGMFGRYRYGSELLNVTYDPTIPEEYASYGWDDDGSAGEKTYLIRAGILERPLGGAISQARAGIAGTANTRANSWNRPPIDRMANLNIEPGDKSLDELIKGIERGVMMDTNRSWSIDDSRNKFQFGCERGWLIEEGRVKGLVKNPGYRGVSATFWRALSAVGDASTLQVLGTPFCGKGEPNQVIHVGHASPACVFSAVDVFGGE